MPSHMIPVMWPCEQREQQERLQTRCEFLELNSEMLTKNSALIAPADNILCSDTVSHSCLQMAAIS